MTFKVWDKVRCIDVGTYKNELTEWKIYTVETSNDEYICITSDKWLTNQYFFTSRFELVQEDKLPHELLWLPKYFVVEKDESDPLWNHFLDWFNSYSKKLSKPIRSCTYNWSTYMEDTIDWVSIEDMKATRDNINSKILTHRNLFNNPKKWI